MDVANAVAEIASEPRSSRARARRVDPFWLVSSIALLWAAYQNLWRLRFPAVAADEPTYAVAGWRYLHGTTHIPPLPTAPANSDNFEHPPLAKYLYGTAEWLAGHVSVPADRIVSGCCVVLLSAIVAWWIGRAANRWTGLAAGLLVAVLPMHVPDVAFRLGRYAMLDPVAELFMVASLALSWLWFRHAGRPAWLLAVATGAVTGLASASKENGFLGVVVPVLLGIAFRRGWPPAPQPVVRRVGQAAAASATAVLVFGLLYLPLPHPRASLRYLLEFQSHQSGAGHFVGFAGRVTAHPPWWTFLWFAGHGVGSVVVVTSLACVLAALVLRHDLLTWWCVAALVGPLVFHMFIAGVVLSYYWVMWMPAYLALVALGSAEVGRIVTRRATAVAARTVAIAMLAAAVTVFGFTSVRASVRLATAKVTGPSRLAAVRARHHLSGRVLVSGLSAWEFWNVPVRGLAFSMPASLAGYDTVVVATGGCRHVVGRDVKALVAANAGTLRRVYRDDTMTVYGAHSPLRVPTSTQVAAQPPPNPAAGC